MSTTLITEETLQVQHQRWQRKNRRRRIRIGELVSIKLPHSKGVAEYMWFLIVFITSDRRTYVGSLVNRPILLNMVLGEELQFEREDIIDLKTNLKQLQ